MLQLRTKQQNGAFAAGVNRLVGNRLFAF